MGKMFESTPAYQKGLIGEEIVKKYLESHNHIVRRPDDRAPSGASVVDFVIEDDLQVKWFVEVKVKSPSPYAYGRFQVYMFPKTQIDLYKRYEKEKDSWIELYIVDEHRESIFVGVFGEYGGLDEILRIEDKTFPLDLEQSNGLGIYRVYSIHQFHEVAKIDFSDLERLRLIKFSDKEKKVFKLLYKSAEDISTDELLADSREVVIKYLNINLPDDLPTKNKKLSTFVQSLVPKLHRIPTCFFYEIYHAVHNINMEKDISAFVSKFYSLLDEIKHGRKKNLYKKPKFIEIKHSTKKVTELKTPNGTLLEILEVKGNNPSFFTSKIQLEEFLEYECRSSHFYTIPVYSEYEYFIPVKDIQIIVNECIFNRVDEISKYDEAKKFIEWWEEVSEPYLEPQIEDKQEEKSLPQKNNSFTAEDIQSIGKMADSIMEVMSVDRQNALQAAIKIKSKELNMDLTSLIELLK